MVFNSPAGGTPGDLPGTDGGASPSTDRRRDRSAQYDGGEPAIHESKPSPSRSSDRSHRVRWPARASALATDQRVRLMTADRSGSGGNGTGLPRTVVRLVS